MIAEVDFEVLLHISSFINVDLVDRGVYTIKVNMMIKDEDGIRVRPVEYFSAATSFDSFIGGRGNSKNITKLQCPLLSLITTPNHISEHDESFLTRPFVVRFRDEMHELSEGVTWRFTVPDVDLNKLSGFCPALGDLLFLKFELLFVPFTIPLEKAKMIDYIEDIRNILPSAKEINHPQSIATQTIAIQRATSGVHQYFPVTFDRANFACVDCVFHCGVTSIRIQSIDKEELVNSNIISRQLSDLHHAITDSHQPTHVISSSHHRDHSPSSSSHSSTASSIVIKTTLPRNVEHPVIIEDSLPPHVEEDDLEDGVEHQIQGESNPAFTPSSTAPTFTSPMKGGDHRPNRKPFSPTAHPHALRNKAPSVIVSIAKDTYSADGNFNTVSKIQNNEVAGAGIFLTKLSSSRGKGKQLANIAEASLFRNRSDKETTRIDSVVDDETSAASLGSPFAGVHFNMFSSDSNKDDRDKIDVPLSTRVAALGNVSIEAVPTHVTSPSSPSSLIGSSFDSEHSPIIRKKFDFIETNNEIVIPGISHSQINNKSCNEFSREDIIALLDHCSKPIIANFNTIKKYFNILKSIFEEALLNNDMGSSFSSTMLSFDFTPESVDSFYIISHREQIIQGLMCADSSSEVFILLAYHINTCNKDLTDRWVLLVTVIKAQSHSFLDTVKLKYQDQMRLFWKRQIFMHSCNPVYKIVTDLKEDWLMSSLMSLIKREDEKSISESIFARGLNIFDNNVYKVLEKLPTFVCQQFIENESPSSSAMQVPGSGPAATENAVRGGPFRNGRDNSSRVSTDDIIFLDSLHDSNLGGSNGNGDASVSLTNGKTMLNHLISSVSDQTKSIMEQIIDAHLKNAKHWGPSPHPAPVTTAHKTTDSPPAPASAPPQTKPHENENPGNPGNEHSSSINGGINQLKHKIINEADILELANPLRQKKHKKKSIMSKVHQLLDSKETTAAKKALKQPSTEVLKLPTNHDDKEIPHLIILVHGFQGKSFDMRLLRNTISLIFPSAEIYSAKSNNDHNEDSIKEMSKRLAKEVMDYIRDKTSLPIISMVKIWRLSFIGHSAGGLVIRRALEDEVLAPVLSRLYAYVSLGTPHLGTMYAESQLVCTGMWVLQRLKNCHMLNELSLDDKFMKGIRESVVYKLSGSDKLGKFKHVIFCSSPQDSYVPTYSARVQISRFIDSDNSQYGVVIKEMVDRIHKQLKSGRFYRITIDNNVEEYITMDNFIGRAGHICYLENPVLVLQLVYTLYSFLE